MKAPNLAAQSEKRASTVAWLALLAPAIAWSAQELACFYITAIGCDHGRPGLTRALLVGTSALALSTTLTCSIAGYRSFRRIARDAHLVRDEGQEYREMVALLSASLGILLTLAVIWGALPSLLVSNMCGAGA
jgi:hypothetical protein